MLSSINLPGGVQVRLPLFLLLPSIAQTNASRSPSLPHSDENSSRTSCKCGRSSKRATCSLRRYRRSSATARCLCIPVRSNTARSVPPSLLLPFPRLPSLQALTRNRPLQLKNGQLVCVPPALIVRAKSHFHTLPAYIGVDLIVGLNGYIWVSKTIKRETRADGEEVGFGEESGEAVYSSQNEVRFV